MTEELAEWADVIFVMEKRHKDLINKHTNKSYLKKIRVLHIPDRFKYYQKELIELLNDKLDSFLKEDNLNK